MSAFTDNMGSYKISPSNKKIGKGGNNIIMSNFNKNDADRVDKLILDIDENICGRVCVTPCLHGLYFLKEYMKDKCKVYVEIGVFFGGSMIMQMQQSEECLFIGIDPFTGYYKTNEEKDSKFGDEDPLTGIPVHIRIAGHNIIKNNMHDHKWYLIKGLSSEPKTIQNLKNILESRKIDILFIDGDHSFDGVMNDFNMYKDLININGYIVFDNYNTGWSWPEVGQAVDEILDNLNNFGFKHICTYGRPKIEDYGAIVIIQKIE